MNSKEMESFLRCLSKDPEQVLHVGLSPLKLSNLVNYNWFVASECLVCLNAYVPIHFYLD